MSIWRNLAFMSASTLMRLTFGLLTFVAMARMLGPTQFGVVMLWISVATLLALIANFGLTPYMLREIGATPERVTRVFAEVLVARLLLSLIVLMIAGVILFWLHPVSRIIFLLLLGAQLADSLNEHLNVAFRATDRFGEETRIALIVAVTQCLIVVLALWWDSSTLVAAWALLVSRVTTFAATWVVQQRHFTALRTVDIRAAWSRIRAARAYALDFGLQSLFGQVDSVVLNYFIGPLAVGVHQAGMRLFNGGAQVAGILANVFLPRAASLAAEPIGFRREAAWIQWAYLGFGFAFGMTLCVAANPVVDLLFGQEYAPLGALLPWFGVLFFVRFLAASWGLLLTSAGRQTFRTGVNALQWLLIAALSFALVPAYGLLGWLICLVAGNAMLVAAYAWRGHSCIGMARRQPLTAAVALVCFVPFLNLPWL